ncbi:MAG: hypothetical protein QOE58_731 [Actinomycetota bacterium]|nr:hypothetical protein [Actinomycetota bacterium]
MAFCEPRRRPRRMLRSGDRVDGFVDRGLPVVELNKLANGLSSGRCAEGLMGRESAQPRGRGVGVALLDLHDLSGPAVSLAAEQLHLDARTVGHGKNCRLAPSGPGEGRRASARWVIG